MNRFSEVVAALHAAAFIARITQSQGRPANGKKGDFV
jgi:hypothetical protein